MEGLCWQLDQLFQSCLKLSYAKCSLRVTGQDYLKEVA